jgi:hypothetical protein
LQTKKERNAFDATTRGRRQRRKSRVDTARWNAEFSYWTDQVEAPRMPLRVKKRVKTGM